MCAVQALQEHAMYLLSGTTKLDSAILTLQVSNPVVAPHNPSDFRRIISIGHPHPHNCTKPIF
jgi:hypothetical protein